MITNYPSLFALIVSIVSVIVLAGFLFPKQVTETLRPQDQLTGLRRIILAILVVSVLSTIPTIIYQYFRMVGHEYDVMRNVVTVTSQISRIANLTLLVMVFNYHIKDEE